MAVKINHARREHFKTSSGIELPVDFNPSNTEEIEYDRDLGDPGEFPYTRGIRPNMYRGRLWTMRQYAGYATAEESNARYKYLLSQGTTGLSVAFDLPTQIGLDSDDPLAAAGGGGGRRGGGFGAGRCRVCFGGSVVGGLLSNSSIIAGSGSVGVLISLCPRPT